MNADQTQSLPTTHKRVVILGSTGSIGTQTLEVIEHLNALTDRGEANIRFGVVGLAAGSDHETLFAQAKKFGVPDAALCAEVAQTPDGVRVRTGPDAAMQLIDDVECDLVVGSIVGIAGLRSTLRAAQRGFDIALANKESLVAGGDLVTRTAFETGARLLPVDSEHAGVWQCLAGLMPYGMFPPLRSPASVSRVVLTASGGAFRDHARSHIENASVQDALKHPNWDMGAKVTIDTATLMNKALELLEAHWLFGLGADRLGAVIHPQSIVHAMIECSDCSVIAQLGEPDMKAPIQHALCDGQRPIGCAPKLDVTKLGNLNFIEIDPDRFPAIELAMRTIEAGGDSGAALNAANEHAVGVFMNGNLPFGQIDRCVEHVMNRWSPKPTDSIEDVLDADRRARAMADEFCSVKGA